MGLGTDSVTTPSTTPSTPAPASNGPAPAGQGINGNNNQTPPTPTPVRFNFTITMIFSSLQGLAGTLSGGDLAVNVMAAVQALKTSLSKSDAIRIEVVQLKRKGMEENKTTELNNAQQKQRDAEAGKEGSDIWNKIKLAFMALGAALQLVLGVIFTAIGAFPLGAFLLMGAAINFVMLADAITAEVTGHGMVYETMKAWGASDEVAMGFDITFQVIMMIAAIAVAVLTIVVPFAGLTQAMNIMNGVETGVSITSSLVTASGDMAYTVKGYSSTLLEADAKDHQALAKQYDAIMTALNTAIDRIFDQIKGVESSWTEILQTLDEMVKNELRTLFSMSPV